MKKSETLTYWELAAIERSIERGKDDGWLDPYSAKRLLDKLDRTIKIRVHYKEAK